MSSPTSHIVDESNNYGDFYFLKEVQLGDKVWKMYGRKMFSNQPIVLQETFVPYRPLDLIFVEERVGIYGETVRRFPSVVQIGQTFKACNTETNETEEITI
jgi:hypothetical protein